MNTQQNENITVKNVPTDLDAKKSYLGSVGWRDDGSWRDNGTNAPQNLFKFLAIIKDVTSRSGSFSIQDVLSINRNEHEIPYEELNEYWQGWIKEMLRLNKIEEIRGAYDYPVYISIG